MAPGAPSPRCRAWLAWGASTLYFFYAFFQRTAPSVFLDRLQVELGLDGAGASALVSMYFYSYSAIQFPLGIYIDRLGPVPVLAVSSVLTTASSLMFALLPDVGGLIVARLLVGATVAAGWLCILAHTKAAFPKNAAALTGISMMIGIFGGAVGQGPLALAVEAYGWRNAMAFSTLLSAVTALCCCYIWALQCRICRTVAADLSATTQAEVAPPEATSALPVRTQLRLVCCKPITWVFFTYGIFSFAPLLVFAGLWAVPFFLHVDASLDRASAGALASVFLIASGVGAPLGGVLADWHPNRKKHIIVAAIGVGATMMVLVLFGAGTFLPPVGVGLLMAIAGLAQGPLQILSYFLLGENSPASTRAAAMSILNSAGLAAGAIWQPAIGALLDMSWEGETTATGIVNATEADLAGAARVWPQAHMRAVVAGTILGCYAASACLAIFCFPRAPKKRRPCRPQAGATKAVEIDVRVQEVVSL